MRGILRSWWEVMKALGNVMRHTLRLFWRDPARMLYATAHHYLGDKKETQRLIKKIEEKL